MLEVLVIFTKLMQSCPELIATLIEMNTSDNLTFSNLSFYFARRAVFKAYIFKTFLSVEYSLSIVCDAISRTWS